MTANAALGRGNGLGGRQMLGDQFLDINSSLGMMDPMGCWHRSDADLRVEAKL